MPTPDRTSLREIVAAARSILEADGMARVTMQAVADRVGVRAPSLYKRVKNREALVGLIAEAAVIDLGERLEAAVAATDVNPRDELAELVATFRAFAHSQPAAYRLIFAGSDATSPQPELLARVSAPVLRVARKLAGPDQALEAARTITAWASGFIGMELAGAFRLGGDVESAYNFGTTHLANALALRPHGSGSDESMP